LSWKKWGKRFNNYLEYIELYLQPDLILLGGGASKYFEEFKSKITIETPVVPATLQNTAGIVGAAMYANLF
jgi:polyphosphate glucokinase